MSSSDDRQPPPRSDSPADDWPREAPAPAKRVRRRSLPTTGQPTSSAPASASASASPSAPAKAVSPAPVPAAAASASASAQAPAPASAPQGHSTGLPPAAVSTAKPAGRYPGRTHPRTGDAVLTALLTVILYILVVVYVRDAFVRDAHVAKLLEGAQLSTILAVAAPIVLAVFSTIFAGLFVLRRVVAFWLPIIAAILIVALYSVTQGMLDTAVVNSF